MLEEREVSINDANEAEVEEDLVEVKARLFVTVVEDTMWETAQI